MALTNDLISQFAKITKQNAKTKSESIVYGTIVDYNDSKYVQIDGSNVLTPYTSTTNVAAGERVTVMIKNHTATVTGNKTSPAVRTSELAEIGDQISDFEIVIADKVDTLQLVAVEARIKDLEADNVVINDTLIANKAQINDLEVKKLSATDAEIQYANIDFANIGKAAMEYFYAKSGLIENVTVGDQTITGNLVGVTINGDRIEGNTIIAEKLVIKGDDGLYYKLNTDGMSVEAEQTEYNSLNGTIIQAKSITATKIDVKDLVAFDATIGGFEINDNAIHSITKTTVDNTTRGIYMDNDGQFVVGDASNYMKYYKTSDGSYKLEISTVNSLQTEVDNVKNRVTNAETTLSLKADQATLTSAANGLQSQIDAVPGQITAAVGDIQIGGTNLLRETGWYVDVADTSAGWIYSSGAFIEYPYDAVPGADDFYDNGFIHWTGEKAGDCNTPRVQTKAGEVYTLSFRHRGGVLQVHIVGMNAAGTQSWGPMKEFANASTKDCSYTFTIPSDLDVSSIYVVFRTTAGSAGVLGRIKLERGNKATTWSPHPQDNARGVVNGSALAITPDAVTINTPVFGVNVSGTNGDMSISETGLSINRINSPSVLAQYDGPASLYVTGTANGTDTFATLSDVFARLSNKHLPYVVAINVNTSYTDGTGTLQNVTGADIVVHGHGNMITSAFDMNSVQSRVMIDNLHISCASENPWDLYNCSYVYMQWCIITANRSVSQWVGGINVQNGTTLTLESCTVNNAYVAVNIYYGSRVSVTNCKGSNNTYAFVVRYMSTLGMRGYRPPGSILVDGDAWAGTDPGVSSTDAPAAPEATTTVTLTATNTRTHGGSWYSGTNVLSQGISGGTSFYGYMWFDLSSISGKTIKSASIRLYRRAGVGRGVPVEVYVGTHNATGPSGGLSMVNSYSDHLVGKVDQKETLSASVATAAVQALASGSATGLFVHSGSSGYAQFDGYDGSVPPQLTVTYS